MKAVIMRGIPGAGRAHLRHVPDLACRAPPAPLARAGRLGRLVGAFLVTSGGLT